MKFLKFEYSTICEPKALKTFLHFSSEGVFTTVEAPAELLVQLTGEGELELVLKANAPVVRVPIIELKGVADIVDEIF